MSRVSFQSDAANLSSVKTGLEDLAERIVNVADSYAGGADEDLSVRLYEVERNLLSAGRRLGAILKDLEER